MKLVSVDSTGIYVYEYKKNENIENLVENLKENNIDYYITKKYNTITILK